ncbi:MAG: hypothetical protein JWO06_2544 [Bacteroidota bacterium]|nr:hypothetical protein [Bacteroidota bacterium]
MFPFRTKFFLAIAAIILLQCTYAQPGNHATQATSAIQINDTVSKMQCSAVGVGLGQSYAEAKKLAEENQNKALCIARRRGSSGFSNKQGSGACNCVRYK